MSVRLNEFEIEIEFEERGFQKLRIEAEIWISNLNLDLRKEKSKKVEN